MFQKILLPVDLTDRHQRALSIAAELASQSQGTVTLLHVIETISGLSLDEERDFYDRLEETARDHLHRLAMEFEKHKQKSAKVEIRYGHRAAETIRYASETTSDLIVLTAPRIDPANPSVGWGSLGYRIGFLSQCPVLMVK